MSGSKNKRLLHSAVCLSLALAGAGAAADGIELSTQNPSIAAELGAVAEESTVYIVRLQNEPLATYEGDLPGFAATSPARTKAKKINPKSQAVRRYEAFLKNEQKKVLDNANKALGRQVEVKHEYQHAFNGFAAVLTPAEAKQLARMDGVISVQPEGTYHLDTDNGPMWIGAPFISTGPLGTGSTSQGEGVVIAVLDTGINSTHPSFAAVGGDGFVHTNPLGSGNFIPGSYCDTDPGFCNDKLIGAWSFVPGDPNYPSPEDSDGHGSHTTSTAAGNVVFDAELIAPTTSLIRDVTGVAPRANLVIYDVCIVGCPGAALVAAVNQVLIDAGNLPNGIAALNYSISGGNNPYNDAVELGFLAATAAGVYVSASAGNSGPGPATVGHRGPWVSTVAASTHDRIITNLLTDLASDSASLPDIGGLGLTSGFGPAPIVNSADLEGTFPGATLCGIAGGQGPNGTSPFPPGTFDGEIVACTRGTFGRVEKGENVLFAGAGGYILIDNGAGLVGDAHALPGIHITAEDGAELTAWLAASENPTGSIRGFEVEEDPANGDIMAGFSSRGPNPVFGAMKPDISAPGVSILAAVEDQGDGAEFGFLSGTSMSSPHSAGAGALLSALHPDWTPFEIRSALMLTAVTEGVVKEDGITPATPFDIGAGRIDLSAAGNPGLVLDETIANFEAANPDLGGDPTTLNLASMQDNNCVGTCSWTRTVRNPMRNSGHWTLSVDAPEGVQIDVHPTDLKVKAGRTAEITVTADTALAEPGWHFARLNLERNAASGADLGMPIAIFAGNATNPDLFSKTVDLATAGAGDVLGYEIRIVNGPLAGPIDLVDVLPDGVEFVPGSAAEVVTDGTTTVPFAFDPDTNSLGWSGELDVGGIEVNASPAPFSYLPLSSLGVAPFALPGNCDEGGWILNIPAFRYNNETYNQVIWSVNGTIEAGTSSGLAASFINRNMPDPALPNNLIAPLWTDLILCDAGAWRVATLNVGPDQFTVYDWEDVPFYDSEDRVSFQIWVLNGGAEQGIWFTYGRLDTTSVPMTVGAENADGTDGEAWFFNGQGTPPAVGTDLEVISTLGGTATFTFEAEAVCDVDVIANLAEIESEGRTERALAVTRCE